jgi:F-type H+-transporting ATPase subunit alpha
MSILAGSNRHFDQLVKKGNPIGEVIGINQFLIHVKGLHPTNVHALVVFENGQKGMVQQINHEHVIVLYLGNLSISIGSLVVVQQKDLVCKVGKDFIGRVINSTGEPLDGKGAIPADSVWPVFNPAPPIMERELLTQQLESGVMTIDALFPIVRGQRMAVLGDSKSGKSTLMTQLALNQKNTDQIVVYVLIAKKRADINTLISRLKAAGSMDKTIVIATTSLDSLALSYLAPYVGCALAEYLWQTLGQDTIIVYDDLTTHAHIYREIALLSSVSPGRDSYPGDMFYAHSSLLERAGRLKKNKKHLTSIPIVLADDGDITAYLPTNIMSITDGQWILDMSIFRKSVRPAINMGLSVTRVGSVGHNTRQKRLAIKALKTLSDYRQAEGYSHFGSELSTETKEQLVRGEALLKMLTQLPNETFSLLSQQLMLEMILGYDTTKYLDLGSLKMLAQQHAPNIKTDDDYKNMIVELTKKCVSEPKAKV